VAVGRSISGRSERPRRTWGRSAGVEVGRTAARRRRAIHIRLTILGAELCGLRPSRATSRSLGLACGDTVTGVAK
jgi:hypothetical protein